MVQQAVNIKIPSPEQIFEPDWLHADDYHLVIKRDDLIHPVISGNKWRKLKYSLAHIQQLGFQHIFSFGGGYSNHLHALGYCCHILKVPMTAIVRGDYSHNLTPMLADLQHWGINIRYINREQYRLRDDPGYLQKLSDEVPDSFVLPEGGSHGLALQGVAEIIQELQQQYDIILLPVGSGGTLAGLAASAGEIEIVGIAVLKGQGYLEQSVQALLPNNTSTANWKILHDFHHGGYAKQTPELQHFCKAFSDDYGIPLEPVYSGKLFYALKILVERQAFPKGSRILALHTGGMQAAR